MAVSTTATPSKPDDTPNNSSVAKPKNDEPGSVLEEFDNRKTCHQCRQRTLNSVAHCKNQRLDSKYSKHRSYQKPCPNKYCTKCLLNRYGEKVEEVEMLADWKCPKCRDICNCSNCRKSKGHEPTGCLAQTAKKTGFSSVSDMLIAKGPENFRYTRVVKDEQMLKTPKKCGKENSVVVNGEVSVQKHPLTSEGDVKKDGEEKPDGVLMIDLNCAASALEGTELKPMKKEKKVKRKEDGVILEKKRRKKSHLSKDSTPGESNKDGSATADNVGLLEKTDSKNLKQTLEANETNGFANHGNGDGGLKLEMKGDTSSCVLEKPDSKPPKKAKRTKKSGDGTDVEKKRRKKSQILEDTAQKSIVQEDGSLKLEMKGDTSSCVLENIDSKPPKKGKKTKKSDDGAVLEKKRRKKKDTAQKPVAQEDMLKDTKDSVMKDSKDSLMLLDLNEAPVDEIVCNGQAKPKSRPVVDKVKKDAEEVRKEVAEIPIQLPQGIDLKAIVGVDLLDEDVGSAIQFLEFCKAFGEVFDLKIGQPETLLRDLTSGTSRLRTRQYSPIIRFQIKLLSLIQENLGERSLSPSSKGSSMFQALQKCISNSHCKLEELPPNCFDKGGVVYEQLDSSQKLKILNYLCDETLSTDELRAWIEKQNLKLEEREREARQKVLAAKNKEKDMKQQILVEMSKQPCNTETDDSLSTIRADTEKAHAEVLEAISMVVNKKQRSDAVRRDPVVSDGNGHIFWRLPGYSPESDILLQDIGSGDPLKPQEKWFTYDVEQKQVVEKCVSSLRKRCKVQALKRKELLKPASPVTLT